MSSDASVSDSTANVAPSMAVDVASSSLATHATRRMAAVWEPMERALSFAGDWLNPILVKETRQALKSWHFMMTFVLLLVACWVVTIGGIAMIGPSVFYSAAGGTMLLAYYVILAFPLIVAVPYSAFRSLASEREDNTYDLLSITTLKPRQIISGKLGSTVGQITVFFSAITPCLAFTYLLRGVDVPTIVVLLVYTFFGSLGLSMIGLLLATISRQRVMQVFVSVAFVAFLIWTFWIAKDLAYEVIRSGYSFVGDDDFWIGTLIIATIYASFFALAYFAAAGMITFTSENRSTPLRICMLVQQATLVGWFGYAWISSNYEAEGLLFLIAAGAVYWFVMGSMLTSERPEISRRVLRRLPSSFLGRVFLTWLNPGPYSGYMFAVASASAIVVIALLGMSYSQSAVGATRTWIGSLELLYLMVIGWAYLVGYLGLGLLVITLLRRVAVVTMLASVLIHFLLLLAGSGIPTTIQMMSVELRDAEYSFLQITNPFWSLKHIADGGALADADVLAIIVPTTAICILLLNIRGVVRELRQVRTAAPRRVAEDEAQLHPLPAAGPQSPWDEV